MNLNVYDKYISLYIKSDIYIEKGRFTYNYYVLIYATGRKVISGRTAFFYPFHILFDFSKHHSWLWFFVW